MIRVREGDVETLISIDEFEARARSGEMSPFAWVCIPTLTGDRFVQARELSLFVALYDPRRLHFRRHFALGRLPLVTGLVAALCVALFLISRHLGDGVVTREVLLDLGAKARARILEDGEAWRLLAANLLHRDIVHLSFNLFALLNIGTVLEGVYRRGDYVLVLVVSGLCTMATSAVMSGPVTVGASGLVFGCLGCAVVFGWRYGDVLPLRYRTYFGVVVVGYAAAMFYLGLRSPSTDNWGHAGGLLAGFVLGGVLTPRLMRLTDEPREPLRELVRPFVLAALVPLALLLVGPLLPRWFVHMTPYTVEAFGVVLERPAHWTKAKDPLGFLTFGNGVDAFASLGCADRRGPSRLDEAAERFVGTELVGLSRGGHIGDLNVSEPVPSAVGSGAHTEPAVRVHFSFMASDGPLEADALLFSRGQLECALVLAARPTASPTASVRLDDIRARLRFVPTRAEVLAKRNVSGRPSSSAAWLDLAFAHQRGGAIAEARAAFEEAERLSAAESSETSRRIGQIQLALATLELGFAGNAEAAAQHAERAVTLTGGDRDATLVLLEALLEQGELERARAHLAAARERLGADADLDALEKRIVAAEAAHERGHHDASEPSP